jgi:hypothetical protein
MYFCCTLCVPVTPVLCVDAPEATVMTCQYNKYSGEFEELRKEELLILKLKVARELSQVLVVE